MRSRTVSFAALASWVTAMGALSPVSGQPQPIRIVCTNIIRTSIETLAPQFERTTGRKLTIRFGASAELKRGVDAGEQFDVALLTVGTIDSLLSSSHIAKDTRFDIGQSDLAIAVRAGAPHADIQSSEALKRFFLSAKSIAYSKDGGGVPAIRRMFETLEIAEQLRTKIIEQTPAGTVAVSVAKGDVGVAIAPLTEMAVVKGAEILGRLPNEFQSPLAVAGGVSSTAADPQAARAFTDFLKRPESVKAIYATGITPIAKN